MLESDRIDPSNEDGEYLVADIGGTHLRVGRYSATLGLAVESRRISTPSFETMPGATPDEIFTAISNQLRSLSMELGLPRPKAIGVAFAGPIDGEGRVLAAPTIVGRPLPEPVDFGSHLRGNWPASEFLVVNDVTAAGLHHADDPNSDFCIVTVSSGIGCKIFLNGKPMLGSRLAGGEIGHWRMDYGSSAAQCDCGGIGHLGALASGRGALRLYRQRSGDQTRTNYDLVQAFHETDALAVEVVRLVASPLASALALIHLAVGIERFIIYGGFAAALGEKYRELLAEAAGGLCWNGADDWLGRIEIDRQDDLSLRGLGRHISNLGRRER